MSKIGRNDPCPCGSGKKYKSCCLAKDIAYQNLLQKQREAKIRALIWLEQNYGEPLAEAIHDGFFMNNDDAPALLEEKSQETQMQVEILLHEWVIGDAFFVIDGDRVAASKLLLGPGGPRFSPEGRRHLESLVRSELSLYEVLEVHENKGLLLRDMLRPGEDPVFVKEKKATEQLVVWDTIAVRVLREEDGTCTLGGSVCYFTRDRAQDLVDWITREIKRESRKKHPSLTPAEITTLNIIALWVKVTVQPPVLPTFVDAKTQEPLLFTTDTYRVSDWPALERALAARDDVDREKDGKWTWIEHVDEDSIRSLAQLERLADDTLEVQCRTVGMADMTGKWLKEAPGVGLRLVGRETRDPRDMLEERSSGQDDGTGPEHGDGDGPESGDEIPPELEHELLSRFLRDHYEKWPTMPLPALDGKTPLQAARLKTYRLRVVNLVKGLEAHEARRVRGTGMPPMDFGFLWERLGLTRE